MLKFTLITILSLFSFNLYATTQESLGDAMKGLGNQERHRSIQRDDSGYTKHIYDKEFDMNFTFYNKRAEKYIMRIHSICKQRAYRGVEIFAHRTMKPIEKFMEELKVEGKQYKASPRVLATMMNIGLKAYKWKGSPEELKQEVYKECMQEVIPSH